MKLIDKAQAINWIALLAKKGILNVQITEDTAFKHGDDLRWITLGNIQFFKGRPSLKDADSESSYGYDAAVRYGGFEWKIPNADNLKSTISQAFNNEDSENKDDAYTDKIKKSIQEGLQDILRRTLIQYPVFDAATLMSWPLQRPVTIVPDTSAIHQGALDFVCRFLTPWVRIKIPAIVHMEITNNADNYFKIRFSSDKEKQKPNTRSKILRQHVLSQGGHRTLLRMELNPRIELDRGDLGADPLRGIVTPSSDAEDKNLSQQHIVRSFADRLIIETARRFQFDVRPDHPLFLLTSDQGMARMAMAEGMGVVFFQARSAPQFEDRTLTGALLAPFSDRLHTVSFADVLWELAVSFGGARLCVVSDPEFKLEVWGIGAEQEGVTWQPYHAREDLLWANFKLLAPSQISKSSHFESLDHKVAGQSNLATQPFPTVSEQLKSSYQFSPDRLFDFIGVLVREDRMAIDDMAKRINVRSWDSLRIYIRFLVSGQLIHKEGKQLQSTPQLNELWHALLSGADIKAGEILRTVPSINELWGFVANNGKVAPDAHELPTVSSARPNYFALGEAVRAWVRIVDHGIVYTPFLPSCEEFMESAMAVYANINQKNGTGWILTGEWLERLAVDRGIHPVTVRERVESCRLERGLRVFAEGSTPDTRFDTRTFWMLSKQQDNPRLKRIYFYRGDFLMPGTAAVRIKIE